MICRTVNDPSVIALTPQPHSVDATLFNGAHHQRPSGGIDRSLFSLSCSLYFPTSNKRHRHRHTSLAKIALRPRPIDSPTVSKNACAPPTLCWSDLSQQRFFHIESVISSATQWPLLGETQYHHQKGKRGGRRGPGERENNFRSFFGR